MPRGRSIGKPFGHFDCGGIAQNRDGRDQIGRCHRERRQRDEGGDEHRPADRAGERDRKNRRSLSLSARPYIGSKAIGEQRGLELHEGVLAI
jgi:hypothetical protein